MMIKDFKIQDHLEIVTLSSFKMVKTRKQSTELSSGLMYVAALHSFTHDTAALSVSVLVLVSVFFRFSKNSFCNKIKVSIKAKRFTLQR